MIGQMQHLRDAHYLARWVLVWFALTISVAIASPIVQPQGLQLVCAGQGGMKLLVSGDDGSSPATGHTLHCPLCVGIGAPPPVAVVKFYPVQPLAYVLQGIAAAHIAAATAAPLPARGPPALV